MKSDTKGSSFSGTRDFVVKRFGRDGFARLLDTLPDEPRELFSGELLQSRWYPTAQLNAFMRAADAMFGKGDLALCEEIGRYSAWEQLSFTHKVLIFAMSTDGLLNRIPTMWKTFHNHGRMESVNPHKLGTTLHLHEQVVVDEAFCRRLTGWIGVVGEKTGSKNVRVNHPRCRAKGAAVCEFEGTWEK